MGKECFERHKQPWNADEAGCFRLLESKGQGLKQIAKALGRSEESTKTLAKQQKIKIAKKRWTRGLLVIARTAATRQSKFAARYALDCSAPLAMTKFS